MPEVVIVSAVRTPIGRYAGTLSAVRPDDLASLVIVQAVPFVGDHDQCTAAFDR